eukprot:4766910-Prymnesium_polylepis.1
MALPVALEATLERCQAGPSRSTGWTRLTRLLPPPRRGGGNARCSPPAPRRTPPPSRGRCGFGWTCAGNRRRDG